MPPSIDLALQIALLLTLGVVCQWVAWRMRLPAILPLLLSGLLLGPWLGVLDPDALLGDLLFPVISLGVAIILFEGSLTGIIRNLTSVGVAVTWGVMSAAAHFLVGLDWQLSLLFGALVSVTGPTVIMPMLRSIQPTARVANILRWEGILVDPIGAVLAVLIFELLVTGQRSESLLEFGKVVVLGSVWGVAGGAVLGQVLKRHLMPDYLENYAGLAFVLLVFSASNALGQESGLVAVTMMGLVMANMKDLDIEELLSFKEHLTVVMISMLFIVLAARLDMDQVGGIVVPALLVLAVALFVARPLSVLLSSIGTEARPVEPRRTGRDDDRVEQGGADAGGSAGGQRHQGVDHRYPSRRPARSAHEEDVDVLRQSPLRACGSPDGPDRLQLALGRIPQRRGERDGLFAAEAHVRSEARIEHPDRRCGRVRPVPGARHGAAHEKPVRP